MHLPRLFDALILNNVWLVGLTLVVVLALLWLGVVGGAVGLRWLFRTSRIAFLSRAGDRLVVLARRVATLASPLVVLAAVVALSYGVVRDADLQHWLDPLTKGWTVESLWRLAKMLGMFTGIALGLFYLNALRNKYLPTLHAWTHSLGPVGGHEEGLERVFAELPEVLSLLGAYVGLVVVGITFELTGWLFWSVETLVFVGLVFNAARLLVQIGWLALAVFDGLMVDLAPKAKLHDYYERVRPLLPLARRVVEAMIYVTGAIAVVHRFSALEAVVPFGSMMIELIAVFFFARVVVEVVGLLVYKALSRDLGSQDEDGVEATLEATLALEESHARRVTLAKLIQSLSRFMIYVGMAITMLIVVGVDPLPLLAGLGVVGFAVGLGAQKILQDIICGFFMLLEDQMLIGDYVKVGDTEGVVEHLHLRVSRVRDRFGRVHTIRNGDVGNVINYSRGWTLAVVEMSVAYEADLGEVIPVMESVGEELHRLFPSKVLGPSEVMGVEGMDDSCLRVRTETKVRPGCHYEIKRVLNRLLVEAFAAHDLEIPYPKGIEFDGVPSKARDVP